jgi:acetate kinase
VRHERLPHTSDLGKRYRRFDDLQVGRGLSGQSAPNSLGERFVRAAVALNDLLGTSWSGETGGIASATEMEAVEIVSSTMVTFFQYPVLFTKDVYSALAGLSQFAPIHIQSGLEGMKMVADLPGDVPQFAILRYHERSHEGSDSQAAEASSLCGRGASGGNLGTGR